MNYHIYAEQTGLRIASFLHESDRDICLDALREAFPDCEFSTALTVGKEDEKWELMLVLITK